MKTLFLQYDKHSGPDSIGQHKLVFTMDESVENDFNPMSMKKGTQFLVILIQADTEEYRSFSQETKEETKVRFFKQFHAILAEVAERRGITSEELRNQIKDKLKGRGLIKDSMSELSIEQLGQEIIKLKQVN